MEYLGRGSRRGRRPRCRKGRASLWSRAHGPQTALGVAVGAGSRERDEATVENKQERED